MNNREGTDRAHSVYTPAMAREIHQEFRLAYALTVARYEIVVERAYAGSVPAAALMGAFKIIGGAPECVGIGQMIVFINILNRYLKHHQEGSEYA